jgi:endonuclease/exonuclease/phosphatase family metal-dependent hydrolase
MRACFGVIAILSCIMPATAQTGSGSLRVKLLAYNLHHGEGTDRRLDLQRIANIINSVAPDYAGLQEVDSVVGRTGKVDQPAQYMKMTGMHGVFGKAISFDGGSYGNLTLSKAKAGRIDRIPLPGGEPRMALITDVDLSGGSSPSTATVTFINTHLMVGDAAAALESARLINAYVRDPSRGDTSRPMILMGDMNSTRNTGAIREFLKVWKADDAFDYGIDWVFFRPAGRWSFVKAAKLTTGDAAVASDHLPVTQEMDLLSPITSIRPLPAARALENGTFRDLLGRSGRPTVVFTPDGSLRIYPRK